MQLPILFEGSVKNIRGRQGLTPYVFEFSDRYSVFDWGAMPDHLPGKGQSLAFMSWMLFDFLGNAKNWQNWKMPAFALEKFKDNNVLKKLQKEGVQHHCISLVNNNMDKIDPGAISEYLAVKPVNILHPSSEKSELGLQWNYNSYQEKPQNTLVPLEVIFRFGVPKGSSLLKRTSDIKYCQEIGLEVSPKEGDSFELPIIEFSTKLEPTDRYISYKEAEKIACLSSSEFKSLIDLTTLLALRIKDYFKEVEIELWDGKFEFAFSDSLSNEQRQFMIVDAFGPDEFRLSHKNNPLSKENLRQFYRDHHWFHDVRKAKEIALTRGEKNWQKICLEELKSSPPSLDPIIKENISMLYKTVTNTLAERFLSKTIFEDAWPLEGLIQRLN